MASSSFLITKTYDVFINFRGSDVRDNFLSHLHEALCRNGIDAFIDDNLERGEEISKSLLEKIEDSYTSIIIFSENYAYSPWCLEELVKIVEMGMKFIPVFYRVDPSHVQELTGSYGDAIAQHRQEFDESLVELWGRCLKDVACFSGLVSQHIKPDSNLIHAIVNHTWEKLMTIGPEISYYEGLVGIDSRVKSVQSLLCLDSPNVRVIGIWGMRGIGKSTIARKVYDHIEHQFTGRCYIANVRERLEKTIANSVQTEILSTILGPRISSMGNSLMLSPKIAQRLARRKVLIILDDVDDLDQIEHLIGSCDIYGSGSRIIITSRDKQVLKYVAAEIYEVKPLDNDEALWLFCLHAFKQKFPNPGFEELSNRALEYSEGNPLALKDLGMTLFTRSVEEWEDELNSLKGTSQEKKLWSL